MHSPEIETDVLQSSHQHLADYGITIARFGNLDVNLDDEDNARLKKLAADTSYSRLAGGFLQAAQAEALQGAGEGMAQGGAAVGPMFMGAGIGLAGAMGTPAPPSQAPAPPPPGPGFVGGGPGFVQPPAAAATPQPAAAAPAATTVECAACHAEVQMGSKFCGECGTAMEKHCTNCNADLAPAAKFCAECGTAVTPPSA